MSEILKKENRIGKLQVALYTRGAGMVLFAFWSFLRTFIISLAGKDIPGLDSVSLTSANTFLMEFIIAALDAGLRIYVARCAISFSCGGKFHGFSLILAGIFAVVPLFIMGVYICWFGLSILPMSVMIALVVDAAVVILNVQIIVFSLRLKKAGN